MKPSVPSLPLISVVIPSYNGSRYLGEAIESVLGQHHRPLEIIVVDDGSTDDTPAVALRYPSVSYVRQNNRGLAAARNTGLERSRGEFCVFLDSDDRLLPGALGIGMSLLRIHPDSAFASGHCTLVAPDGSPLFTPPQNPVERESYLQTLRSNPIWACSSVIFRRDALFDVGAFDPHLRAAEDYDLYLRLTRLYPVSGHQEVVVQYRQRPESLSSDPGLMLASVRRVLEAQRCHADDPLRSAAIGSALDWYEDYYNDPLLRAMRSRWNEQLVDAERLSGDLGLGLPNGLVEILRAELRQLFTAFQLVRTIKELKSTDNLQNGSSDELTALIGQRDALQLVYNQGFRYDGDQ